MKKIKLKFEDQSQNWNIWENKSEIERSIQRVKKILPEMECAKQLAKIVVIVEYDIPSISVTDQKIDLLLYIGG